MYLGPRSAWDGGVCGGAMALAMATAMLRMTADVHYATDTIAGAFIGLSFGFLLPLALHFAPWAPLPVARSMRSQPLVRASRSDGDGAPASHRVMPRFPLRDIEVAPWATQGGGGLSISARF
jgi:hypothetical protein